MIKKSVRRPLLLIFGAVLLMPVYSQTTAPSDVSIARLWLERAQKILADENLSSADLEAAASAIAAAGEFQNPGRDSLYLQALLLVRGYPSDNPVRGGYDLLSRSLDDVRPPDGNGDLADFEDRARLWASHALRLHEYREIMRRFSLWPGGHRDDPALLYAAGRAAVYLGLDAKALEFAKQGEALAEDSRVLESLGPEFRTGAQPAFRALAVAAGDRHSIETLDAAWRRWGDGLADAVIPWILSGHIELSDSPVFSRRLPPDMYNSLAGLDDLDTKAVYPIPARLIKDLAYLRRNDNGVPGEIMSGFTGTLKADADYDGFVEELIELVNGSPVSRRVDTDQDEIYDWVIEYDGTDPFYVLLDGGKLAITYEKGSYPVFFSATRTEENLRVDVFFQPGGFQWAVAKDGDFLGSLRYPGWKYNDFWSGVRLVNVTFKKPLEGTVTEARTYITGGYPIRAVEWQYPEGGRDRPDWIRELIYENGIPKAGRRSFRADTENPGTRIWELYERYENGRMVGLAWDPDMTGTPIYLRDWALNRYLQTQVWDLDADRWIDVRRFRLPDGTTDSATLLITKAGVKDLLIWTASDWAPWDY